MERAQPVVILAAPHSDAARFAAMLGQHPRAYSLPELRLFYCDSVGELLSLFSHTGERAGDGLLRALAELFGGGQSDAGIARAERYLERRADWSTTALLHAIIDAVAPRIAVFHDCCAPLRVTELDRWFAAVPDAAFIHLVRHPIGFSEAANRELGARVYYPPDYADSFGGHRRLDPQLLWYRIHHTLTRELEQRADTRSRQLLLESLLRNAPGALTSLCDWFGWHTDKAILEDMLHPERSPFAFHGPSSAPRGQDLDFLSAPQFIAPLHLNDDTASLHRAEFADEVVAAASAFGYS